MKAVSKQNNTICIYFCFTRIWFHPSVFFTTVTHCESCLATAKGMRKTLHVIIKHESVYFESVPTRLTWKSHIAFHSELLWILKKHKCNLLSIAIEKEVKDIPNESRQRLIENLISGDVCEKLVSSRQVPGDKMKSSCMDLLGKNEKNNNIGLYTLFYPVANNLHWNFDPGSHYDQFHSALLSKELKHLEIVLCYEQSTACVGVKRPSSEVIFEYSMKLN